MSITSFVITCRNRAAYLDFTVQSILEEWVTDFEILVVDEASTDIASQHLFVSYQRPFTRILHSSNDESGLNVGALNAKGDFIVNLQAGDHLLSGFHKQAVAPLEVDPALAFIACCEGDAGEEPRNSKISVEQMLAGGRNWRLAAIRRNVLLQHPLDTRALSFAEWDVMIQLVASGQNGLLLPKASIQYDSIGAELTYGDEDIQDSFLYLFKKHSALFHVHASLILSRLHEQMPAASPERFGHGVQSLSGASGSIAGEILETTLRAENLRRRARSKVPFRRAIPINEIDWGDLRRIEPISHVWGLDRGQPVDRYYIEAFLQANASDIKGVTLEIKDPHYTHKFGTTVSRSEILDIAKDNPHATLVADLAIEESLPENRHDCFILTQTIHVIHEMEQVVRNAERTLRPGGVLLATLPCASRVDYESGLDGDHWRFTAASARRVFEQAFGQGRIEVHAYGNVLACCGFLMGVAAEELTPAELDHYDPYFPLLLGVRAVKSAEPDRSMTTANQRSFSQSEHVTLRSSRPRPPFRVIALISTFNEGDIIASALAHLVDNGVDVYLIDNHSTDDTVEQARPWLGRGLIKIESFPDQSHPAFGRFAWTEILKRKAELAKELQADWFIHHDADEIRESPFPGLTLKEAIQWVDQLGYTALQFELFNFHPVANTFKPGMDPKESFHRYEPAAEYDKLQIKCWKGAPADMILHKDGGHEILFADRKVFPVPFILRHYPIRSQEHGRKKVFQDRKARFLESERAGGWHVQYDSIESEHYCFLRNPASLLPFDLESARLQAILAAKPPASMGEPSAGKIDPSEIEGFLDRSTCHRIHGWCWHKTIPATRLKVDLWGDDRLLGTVQADTFRQDLLDAGKHDGNYGFAFDLPAGTHLSPPQVIWANVAGTAVSLRNSPQEFTCTCAPNGSR